MPKVYVSGYGGGPYYVTGADRREREHAQTRHLPLSKAELRSACRILLSTTATTYKSLFHLCYVDNGVWRLVFGSICYWAGIWTLIAGHRILGATFR